MLFRSPPRPRHGGPEQLPERGPLQPRWLSWDRVPCVPCVPCVPFGSSCSCPFPPPLSQGSRWLGLLSHCRAPRTTLSVSPARVNGALSGWPGQPSWRREWGAASFLMPGPASLPGWGVGAGALRAPSCDGRRLPPRGFGSGSGCEDPPSTLPLGQPERPAVSPQPRAGAHWGPGSDHPQDFSYDEPKVEFDVDAPSQTCRVLNDTSRPQIY